VASDESKKTETKRQRDEETKRPVAGRKWEGETDIGGRMPDTGVGERAGKCGNMGEGLFFSHTKGILRRDDDT
jgi:hypothetical protein